MNENKSLSELEKELVKQKFIRALYTCLPVEVIADFQNELVKYLSEHFTPKSEVEFLLDEETVDLTNKVEQLEKENAELKEKVQQARKDERDRCLEVFGNWIKKTTIIDDSYKTLIEQLEKE